LVPDLLLDPDQGFLDVDRGERMLSCGDSSDATGELGFRVIQGGQVDADRRISPRAAGLGECTYPLLCERDDDKTMAEVRPTSLPPKIREDSLRRSEVMVYDLCPLLPES